MLLLLHASEVLRVETGDPSGEFQGGRLWGENLIVPEYAPQTPFGSKTPLQQTPFELAGYKYAELSVHRAVLDIAKQQLRDDQDDMTGRPALLL